MAEYKIRTYPLFSACGLNCGLCPRFYTEGSSLCPGCGGEGFLETHCSCSILPCCERKGIEYCFDCDEFPCKKYDRADEHDSFITHKNQFVDMEKAKQNGMEAYKSELSEKIGILEELLNDYNDGRRKSFYCVAINLLNLIDVNAVMERIRNEIQPEMSLKEKSAVAVRLFNEMAEQRDISLKLRKK
jgi:hypothetical protein